MHADKREEGIKSHLTTFYVTERKLYKNNSKLAQSLHKNIEHLFEEMRKNCIFLVLSIKIFFYFQGDGLEFKRHFIKIKNQMKQIISKVPPAWPIVPSQIG